MDEQSIATADSSAAVSATIPSPLPGCPSFESTSRAVASLLVVAAVAAVAVRDASRLTPGANGDKDDAGAAADKFDLSDGTLT